MMGFLALYGESANELGRQIASTIPVSVLATGETADSWLVGPLVGVLVGLAIISALLLLAFWPSRRAD